MIPLEKSTKAYIQAEKKNLRTNYNQCLKAENKNPHSVDVAMNVIYYLVSYYLKLAEEREMMTGR